MAYWSRSCSFMILFCNNGEAGSATNWIADLTFFLSHLDDLFLDDLVVSRIGLGNRYVYHRIFLNRRGIWLRCNSIVNLTFTCSVARILFTRIRLCVISILDSLSNHLIKFVFVCHPRFLCVVALYLLLTHAHVRYRHHWNHDSEIKAHYYDHRYANLLFLKTSEGWVRGDQKQIGYNEDDCFSCDHVIVVFRDQDRLG